MAFGWGFRWVGASILLLCLTAWAQEPGQSPTPASGTDPDGAVSMGTPLRPKTTAEWQRRAWEMLTSAVQDDKHVDVRIQGLAALGTMGTDARSVKLIEAAMKDKEEDVRTAAALAAGQTKAPALLPSLRLMLDDKQPQVAFAAASTLWKMHDRAGEDILMAVVDGERSANPGLTHGTMHSMSRTLHDPAELAKLGAMQGASMLLGPFGYGITAYEYIRKNGGDSPRVSAVEEIAQDHSGAVRKKLMDALTDKDAAVRAAAAKAVRSFRDAGVAQALTYLFDDSKRPVQLSGAAAYLIATRAVPLPVTTLKDEGH